MHESWGFRGCRTAHALASLRISHLSLTHILSTLSGLLHKVRPHLEGVFPAFWIFSLTCMIDMHLNCNLGLSLSLERQGPHRRKPIIMFTEAEFWNIIMESHFLGGQHSHSARVFD